MLIFMPKTSYPVSDPDPDREALVATARFWIVNILLVEFFLLITQTKSGEHMIAVRLFLDWIEAWFSV
jgi:hypothetical protein